MTPRNKAAVLTALLWALLAIGLFAFLEMQADHGWPLLLDQPK